MSLEALGAVASHPTMTIQERALAYELANCANAETGRCHPSISYLASRLKCTDRTIRRIMHQLEERGVIEIKAHYIEGRQTTNSYLFRHYSGTPVSSRTDTNVSPVPDTHVSPEGDTSVRQNQEEESGRGNYYRGESSGEDSPPPRVPYKKIVDLYHELLPMCPRVVKLTETRKGYIKQRWREDLETLEEWENYLRYVGQSDFLTGKAQPSNGKPPFVADLEWLTRPSNIVKVAEGKYHRGK